MITLRKADDRGKANHGWLRSFHTFSFAEYFDAKHQNFGPLRVINEDYIAGGNGFPMHGHKHMEIITYVIAGALEHKDNLGTNSVILPGEVQKMSAGPGIMHSEFNHFKDKETHLYQIWIIPNKEVPSSYQQKNYADKIAKSKLTLVCSNDGREDSISVAQDVELYVGKLKSEEELTYQIPSGRNIWLQLIDGEISVGSHNLKPSDALSTVAEDKLILKAKSAANFLLFDLKF